MKVFPIFCSNIRINKEISEEKKSVRQWRCTIFNICLVYSGSDSRRISHCYTAPWVIFCVAARVRESLTSVEAFGSVRDEIREKKAIPHATAMLRNWKCVFLYAGMGPGASGLWHLPFGDAWTPGAVSDYLCRLSCGRACYLPIYFVEFFRFSDFRKSSFTLYWRKRKLKWDILRKVSETSQENKKFFDRFFYTSSITLSIRIQMSNIKFSNF